MGFLDRAKKLAEQAKEAADQAKRLAEQAASKASDALADASNRGSSGAPGGPTPGAGPAATGPSATGPSATGPSGGSPSGGSPPGGSPSGAGPSGWGAPAPSASATAEPQYGTPYVPGMLRRPGWRERGLTDPAALLPIRERDRVGVPHSTKSQILEEPFGMGRRWTSGGRSTGVFYQLYAEEQAWEPPGGKAAFPGVRGASAARLPDGRTLVFLKGGTQTVVLEMTGFDDPVGADLARIVSDRLASA